MIKNQIQTILKQEMNRKNFLQYSGGLFLAVIGVTGIVRVLLNGENGLDSGKAAKTNGYGSSTYGS